jgi:FkbM family methyltransferase
MLIPMETVMKYVRERDIQLKGVLHIGAHECEEMAAYKAIGIPEENIVWVEANPSLVEKMSSKGVKVYNAAILDKEAELPFFVTNNMQSSSLLRFGTHAVHHPHVKFVKILKTKTQTLTSFIEANSIPIQERNFWNLDIQGVELHALKSAGDYIKHADIIYTEVNTQDVYKDCSKLHDLDAFLIPHGFTRVETCMYGNAGWGDALYIRS